MTLQIVGALLGENLRKIVPDTYTHMGLWLCKDFIRIERTNKILEDVFKGQYYYRTFLIFANSQNFDLTANRNDIRTDQDEYDMVVEQIKDFCVGISRDPLVEEYFDKNKQEEEEKKERARQESYKKKLERLEAARLERLNKYQARTNLPVSSLKRAVRKEPKNEGETVLLLQAMISAGHPEIDFVIGDYSTGLGVDMIVEKIDKGIPSLRWAEVVHSLDKVGQWSHPPEGFHLIICYELGNVGKTFKLCDGCDAELVSKQVKGRYALLIGKETVDVYVLRELLETSPAALH